MMEPPHREKLILTFALSPKGMIDATEIASSLSPKAKKQLLKMRANAILEKITKAGAVK
jgi:hypothetical protein